MSYSTRRSGGYPQQQQQQQPAQQNVGNIGQRRPVVTNNFVPGGQLKPQQTKPVAAAPVPQARPPPQPAQQAAAAAGIQFRNQQQTQQQQTAQQQAAAAAAAKQLQLQQQQLQQQQLQDQLKQEQLSQVTDVTNGAPMETGEVKKKPFWAKSGGKISRREKVRRRNVRLSRMLQPKNAVMILNELVKNTSYTVDELSVKSDGNQFKATVVYEGVEHVGFGRSKIHAKNTAAEAALKHYVKTNKLTEVKKDEEGNEKMDVAEDEANQSPLPWQHVASFALYKLFCLWGEDPNIVKNQSQPFGTPGDKPHENKPAKKMPDNPESINPLMLINQMLPQAQFEEIGKTGNPPTVVFSFRCNVDGQSFVGTGPNKKAAKKMAAFGACHKILDINYSPEVYVPSY